MNSKRLLLSLLAAGPLLLTGCVGYNTTLFMTKSNAGLDLDTKPPTAEINISRKEGVVEPSFEGGKTPPVIASFSAKADNEGVSRFLFGVNQTFAGGDAAVTMAKLYDRTNDFSDITAGQTTENEQLRAGHAKLFDSGLTLNERPVGNRRKGWFDWRKKLFGLAEPGEVRPFFFGTDTQLGVKVGWNGVGGPYPDTVKIGFNRKEMAIAPVTISDENVVRVPSFLGTIDTDVRGATSTNAALGANLRLGWLQYFATGESAEFLARQYGVRKAMLARTDPISASISEQQKYAEAEEELRDFGAETVELDAQVRTELDRMTSREQLDAAAQTAVDLGIWPRANLARFALLADDDERREALKRSVPPAAQASQERVDQLRQYLARLKEIANPNP